MTILHEIDSRIIDNFFQPFSHRIERQTHVNNFAFSRIITCLFSAYIIVYIVITAENYWMVALKSIVGMFFIITSFRCEKRSTEGLANGTRYSNPFRLFRILSLVPLFMFVVPIFIVLITFIISGQGQPAPIIMGAIAHSIDAGGFMVVLYLLACNPLPPGWKKTVTRRKENLVTNPI